MKLILFQQQKQLKKRSRPSGSRNLEENSASGQPLQTSKQQKNLIKFSYFI